MSHKSSHIIVRGRSYVFNRRVPKHARSSFGTDFVRVTLGHDDDTARLVAERLNQKLDQVWASPSIRPIDIKTLTDVVAPKITTLSEAHSHYVTERGHGKGPNFEKVTRLAVELLAAVGGDRDITTYDREDARAFVQSLLRSDVKTATVRRRLNSIKALLAFAYREAGIEKRNPFAQLQIPGEGLDATRRATFTNDQLKHAYQVAFNSGSEIKLIVPLLGETGCRLAEIVGLRLMDVDIESGNINITPHPARRLKTRGSERMLPLVGASFDAMRILLDKRTVDREPSDYLFPRYEREGLILATHASNAVNKWLKREFDGLTCHSLRHTMRDRLRGVEAPLELIDQIGGWASVGSVGASYGRGYKIGALRLWLERIAVPF